MESITLKRISSASCSARVVAGARSRRLAAAAVQQNVKEVTTSTSAGALEDIYIGFEKEDGYGSREGRTGRIIRDDPRKYPSRDEWGTGGWAGGEAGLWKLREQVQKEKPAKQPTKTPPKATGMPVTANPPPGKAAIYVGFNKDELDLRKTGAKGRVVIDGKFLLAVFLLKLELLLYWNPIITGMPLVAIIADPRKYPGKDDIGPLAGVAGGFAGGEAGLKQFVATGDVKLRKPGEPGPKQFSPLTLAGVVALAGAVGGIVLDLVTNAGENAVTRGLLQAPIDKNTKLLIGAALGLVGVSGLIIAATATVRSLQEKIQETAKDAIVSAAFIFVVFLVAKGILEDF
ncbi:hypothetical protein VOLCADRAFT_120979 [Volvox carteri f. nagariensis]|uniref:Uncharacterized protein n=1 Tax=Volvox carteri f. nagariensis TaxID=3068 RepID=D8TZ19_VOLCA|nr:uncharacterized protein VOLCADRAFT_120979 [Volvox carteri f. nagariensis]EFJ47103.1 hypothetical protein VOLCADRAFT_120979 [Volvox carteri f. nagariensis]|eukprot:XP_002951652.1 hypothetical protein VOLCADRAFT_120979 [Volvox carteri f. nagariensis]